MIRCSQYLYGRSQKLGYSMNKYSDDRPKLPQWISQNLRAVSVGRDSRVLELIRDEGRTVLCNAETVDTEDVYENGVFKGTISTRPYNYTQYVFPHLNDAGGRKLPGREAFLLCLELLLYKPLLLDRHSYQLEVDDSTSGMSARMLTQIPRESVRASYEQAVAEVLARHMEDAALAPDDYRKESVRELYDHFTAEQLGTLVAELWRKAYRSEVKHETEQPLLLITTAPWRYEKNLADERNIISEAVMFLHDELAPMLPDGVADLLSVTFNDSGFAKRSGERGTVKVCVPENKLYQDQEKVLFCPFEGQIYGYRPWRGVASLGKWLAKGMPESYRLLVGHPRAEADYELALEMIELTELCAEQLSEENAQRTADRLKALHTRLQEFDMVPAEAMKILKPLHLAYISACGSLRLDARQPLFQTWMDLNTFYAGEDDVNGRYVNLMQHAMISGQRDVLSMLSKRSDASYYVLETAIIQGLPTVKMSELPHMVKRAGDLMQSNPQDALAEAYLHLTERTVSEPLPEETKGCIRITADRKQNLREGKTNATDLLAALKADASAVKVGVNRPNETALALFKLYGVRKGDPELAEAIEACLLPQIGLTAGDKQVLEAYVQSGWQNDAADQTIAEYIYRRSFYQSFNDEKAWQNAYAYISAFVADESRRSKYSEALGEAFVGGINELNITDEKCIDRILRWPVRCGKIAEAAVVAMNALEPKRPCEQQQNCDRQRMIDAFENYNEWAKMSITLPEAYNRLAELNLDDRAAQQAGKYGTLCLGKDAGADMARIPLLHAAMNGRSVNWMQFLQSAYPMPGKGWEQADLFSSRGNGWSILNKLMMEFPVESMEGQELRMQLTSFKCVQKAKEVLYKRMPKLNRMAPEQLDELCSSNPLLSLLLERRETVTMPGGGEVQ